MTQTEIPSLNFYLFYFIINEKFVKLTKVNNARINHDGLTIRNVKLFSFYTFLYVLEIVIYFTILLVSIYL